MKKIFLSILFILLVSSVCFVIFSCSSDKILYQYDISGNSDNSVTAALYSDGTLSINGNGNMKDFGMWNNHAPWYENISYITRLEVSDGILNIGDCAFTGCTSLQTVELGNDIKYIGNYAFSECDNIVTFTLPNSLEKIGDMVFYGCDRLYSMVFPDKVRSIGKETFYDCSNLISVTLGREINDIGSDSFNRCNKLIEVVNNSGINDLNLEWDINIHTGESEFERIGDCIFGCISGTEYLISYVGNESIVKLPEKYNDKSYEIYYKAFFGNAYVESLIISDGVTNILDFAFSDCGSLKYIEIPDTITEINDCIFLGCTSLGEVTLPDSITRIYGNAFSGCTSLEKIKLSHALTYIGEGAFYGCSSLSEIDIPESVVEVRSGAFSECISLKEMRLPSGLRSISSSMFSDCTSLERVIITDSSFNYIGNYAFKNCTSLSVIEFPSTTSEWNYSVIKDDVLPGGMVAEWDKNSGNYIVICTDGQIVKSE